MTNLNSILFLDIETVPTAPEFDMLSGAMQAEWERKARYLKHSSDPNADPSMLFEDKAGIFSEFAKVVCIGFGSIVNHEGAWKMRLKSLVNEDERTLLTEFCQVLHKFTDAYKELRFCGHNIKEFDLPFLCRRMIINNMELPNCLQMTNKKPWEIAHIDTMDMWKFGDYKHFTALSLLATVLGIPSPKNDMDGSMVADVFYKERDLRRIGTYCLQDVLTSARVYLRLSGMHGIDLQPIFVEE